MPAQPNPWSMAPVVGLYPGLARKVASGLGTSSPTVPRRHSSTGGEGEEDRLSPPRLSTRLATASLLTFAILLTLCPPLQARTATEGLRSPIRLTTGDSEELSGQLSPDGKTLYFSSNRNATWQIFARDLAGGPSRLLFDEEADALAPKVSPRGDLLLYLSFREDATGDACVFDLRNQARRCLTDARTAEAAAFWFPDGQSVGVVSRDAIHGDFRLLRYPLGGGPPEVLLNRNLASPSVSPDGRWLVYVPITRNASIIGVNFARRAGGTLELLPLARLTDPQPLAFPLPGVSAFPAFSADGKYLYFSRFLNDTSLDGVIDGEDHGVIFRTPFRSGQAQPVSPTQVEQLSSAGWNCQFPTPATDQLLVTCAFQGSLDLYTLPLAGSVPEDWNPDRLQEELSSSRDHWQKLLLVSRILDRTPPGQEKARWIRELVGLHLALRELESAAFYAKALQQASPAQSELALQAEVLLELVAARKEELRLSQGRLSPGFVQESRARLQRLEPLRRGPLSVATLAYVASAEIFDIIGEKDKALAMITAVDLLAVQDAFVLLTWAEAYASLCRELDQRQALLETQARLAEHPALSAAERARQAERFVTTLLASTPVQERPGLVEAWRSRVGPAESTPAEATPTKSTPVKSTPASELALRLEVEAWLLKLSPTEEEAVRAGIFELYKGNKDFDRRRLVVFAALRAAAAQDSDVLLYAFANTWVSGLKKDQPERRYAEDLYRQVLLERAYLSLSEGKIPDARGYFYSLTLQVDSLEAHIGYVEAALREGRKDVAEQYATRYKSNLDSPVYAFARAWLQARNLAGLEGAAFESAASQALTLLKQAEDGLPQALEVPQVQAYIQHLRYLRTGDAGLAAEAVERYLLALDLARDNPRARAPLLQSLASLQARLGNHRLALEALEDRLRLPVLRAEELLALRMMQAGSLFQVGRLEEATAAAKAGLELAVKTPGLARYLPLVRSRLALYATFGGQAGLAWEVLEGLAGLSAEAWRRAAEGEGAGREEKEAGLRVRRNQLKVALLQGVLAGKLGKSAQGVQALGRAMSLLEAPSVGEAARGQGGARYAYGEEDYRLLVTGLLAQRKAEGGDLAGAEAAARARIALLEKRLKRTKTDADRAGLARAWEQVAVYAWGQGAKGRAREAVGAGQARAREFEKATGSPLSPEGLALLRLEAELALKEGGAADRGLQKRLREAYETLCRYPSPRQAAYRALFAAYLVALEG